jgi:hypothetical protein
MANHRGDEIKKFERDRCWPLKVNSALSLSRSQPRTKSQLATLRIGAS